MTMLIEMEVQALLFDQRNGLYVVLLKEIQGLQTLPIWIGQPEAESIALALGHVEIERPNTHDLIKNTLNHLEVLVSRIVVTDLKDNTYYATFHLIAGDDEKRIDSRPSDAIATALRVNAPIYVEDNVLDRKHSSELKEWLKNIRPEDFGNII